MPYDEPLYDLNNPMLRGEDIVEEKRYLTDAFTDEALQFIDREKEKPFFLFLSYNAVPDQRFLSQFSQQFKSSSSSEF